MSSSSKKKNINEKAAADQHKAIGIAEEVPAIAPAHTTHPGAQWFENAGLGLFLHWGISSVHGGIDISWGMMANTPWDTDRENRNKVTPAEYFALAQDFNPEKYDPSKWLNAAKEAGFKYAVMTTRHHDGYAMWPSNFGSYGVKQHLGGRDLVKPFIQACRDAGLKAGIYYSPPDWYYHRKYMSFHYGSGGDPRFPGRKHYGLNHEPIDELVREPEGFDAAYRAYARGQVVELLEGYGQLDVIFFDGGPAVISIDEIRSYQPSAVINPRMHGHGDYETPECSRPETRPKGWWERCDIWNVGGWGYAGEGYRPTSDILTILAETRAWGGNLLINCAPKSTGEMPDLYYDRLSELKAWLGHSGEAVFDTGGGPWPERSNIPVTVRGNTWYLHFTDATVQDACVTDVERPLEVNLLRTGEPVPFGYKERQLTVSLRQSMRTSLDDVVAVAWR
ncbi:MAG: alpha-L-fucosidase [Candidatus Latescibacterota bacterium]